VLAFGTHAIAYTGVGSTYVQVPATIALNTTPPAPGALAYNSLESSATTWTLSADYKINDRWMVYATARRGYKAGGFNPSAPAGLTQFAPEKVLDYEIGTKTQWVLGGVRATVNLALFRDDYSNIQRTSTVLLPNGTTGGLTTNVASAVIQGAELEATVDLTDWLSVSGFYEYTDAYYKRWPYQAAHIFPAPGAPPAPGVTVFDFSDNPLAGTPKTKWSLTPRIHLPLGDDLGELSVAVPITHVSRSASNDTSAQSGPSSFIDAHTVADVRVDLRNVRGTNLSLAATVRNVTDETYVQGVLDLTGGGGMIGKFYGPPRMWTIEARYAF
jgi:iron complex outermembrane receptor protein